MKYIFKTYDDFLKEYRRYHMHECSKCDGVIELSIDHVDVQIEDRKMHFKELLMLTCIKCNSSCIPMYSKKMIDGCYRIMVKEGHYENVQTLRGYRKKFDYCVNHDFLYDHRDYYNIPGLSFDEEHSVEGFLTPVYFTKKVLLYFMQDPDYRVRLDAETYGYFSYKDQWGIPFGINRNGKVVFWLGDLNHLNDHTLNIMKPHNIDSDHQLIASEFFAAQMCCVWSEPNKELRICTQKNALFEALHAAYNVSLFHLEDEIKQQKDNYVKPIILTKKTIEPTINMLYKVLVEGVNISEIRKLYLQIVPSPDKNYKQWKSIKFYQALLEVILVKKDDIKDIIAPLYLLNDFRQYYDHLLSAEKKESIQNNIIKSLNITSFDNMTAIYDELLRRLSLLFEYLILGYTA
ncbi:MAG: hypothetical protein N4A64_02285 [Marinisporobacter sp.]|jgi:transcription termination factor NusB|nr:hypothetical protein [Marinisporobacter sp.]